MTNEEENVQEEAWHEKEPLLRRRSERIKQIINKSPTPGPGLNEDDILSSMSNLIEV